MKAHHIIRLGLCAAAVAITATVASLGGQPISTGTKAVVTTRHHSPVNIHRKRENAQYESFNWAGYAVTPAQNAGPVNDVKGTWTVPSVTCPPNVNGKVPAASYSSFWVGIDGFSSSTVEQTGTDSDCSSNGRSLTPVYYAWFEFYPNPSYEILFPHGVQPGDMISAEVQYIGQSTGSGRQASGPKFTVTITDLTKNETFSTSSTVPNALQTSAEWIAEAPCCGKGNTPLPLADFNLVTFNSGSATVQATTGTIASFGSSVQSLTMVSQTNTNVVKASISALTSGFTVNWLNPGP